MRIAYLVDRFPVLSQTFVINEIADHLYNGQIVDILVLEGEKYADFPAASLPSVFLGRVRYLGIEHSTRRNLVNIIGKISQNVGVIRTLLAVAMSSRKVRLDSHFRTFALAAELARIGNYYDIIHSHFGHVAARVAKVRMFISSNTRTVATIHAFEIARRTDATDSLIKLLIDHTDLILPVNSIWRDQLIGSGAHKEKTLTHHMGVDVDKIRPSLIHSDIVKDFSLVITGRMVEKKGHLILLKAISNIRISRPDIKFKLVMVGTGPLESSIKKEIEQLKLEDVVTLKGALSHKHTLEVVESSDLFILPSITASDGDMEGIPVALMEAMAMSIPVISTFHSGIPDLIESGVSGILVKERDVDGLSMEIIRMLDSPKNRQTLGKQGRLVIEKEFNAKTLGQELRNLYKKLV